MPFDAQQVIYEIEKVIIFYINAVIKMNVPSQEDREEKAEPVPVPSNTVESTTLMLKSLGISAFKQAKYAYSCMKHFGEIESLNKELRKLHVLLSPDVSDSWARHLIYLGEKSLSSQHSWEYKRLLHGIRYIILDALMRHENTTHYDKLVKKIQNELALNLEKIKELKQSNASKEQLKDAQEIAFQLMRELESLGVIPEPLYMPAMDKEAHRSGRLMQRNHIYGSFSSTYPDSQILPAELEEKFKEAYQHCVSSFPEPIKGPPPEYVYLKNLGEDMGFMTDISVTPDAPNEEAYPEANAFSPLR